MRKTLLWILLIILLIFSLLSINMTGITAAQVDHDIAVISVTPSSTSVAKGELVNITVVVENQGTEPETFNVTVYYDTTQNQTKMVENLVAYANKSLTLTWNTTSASTGTYTINATASTVPGETDTTDNTLVSTNRVRVFVSPYIAVIPHSTVDPGLTPDMSYTVSIYTDYNGSDVWSYDFSLSYNPNVLNGIEVVNGDLITTDKHPDAKFSAGTFNNTLGKLSLTTAYFFATEKPVPTAYGPGILANVTFTVVGTGESDITLGDDTRLRGWTDGGLGDTAYEIISSRKHILDGFFQNTLTPVTHNIAIISVTPSPTLVRLGELVNITVVVKNQGTMNEDVTVAIYYDYDRPLPEVRRIETKTAQNLAVGKNTSLTFTWDTTDVAEGNYIITAVASVPGDTATRDSDETVTLTLREEPLPVLLIIGIVVALVVAIAVIIYTLKRRKKPTLE